MIWVSLGLLAVVVLGLVLWVHRRVTQLEQQQARMVEVINRITPEFGRKLVEQGTRVAVGERWVDWDEFEPTETER